MPLRNLLFRTFMLCTVFKLPQERFIGPALPTHIANKVCATLSIRGKRTKAVFIRTHMSQKEDRDIALIDCTFRLLSSKGRLWLQIKLAVCPLRGADHGFFFCKPGCLHLQTAVQIVGPTLTLKQHRDSKRLQSRLMAAAWAAWPGASL